MRSAPSTLKKVAFAALLLAALFALGALLRHRSAELARISSTVGELQVIHAELKIGPREVRGLARLAIGDAIASGPDGRGRIRLDDGTRVVMDRATRLRITAGGLALETGRIFVLGGSAARSEIALGDASTIVAASTLALERERDLVRLYCANGEVIVRARSQQQRLRSGESARVSGGSIQVAPEKAWNDWTGGMVGERARASIGELWGRSSEQQGEAGSPLTIRSHEVSAKLDGEQAHTRIETSYFNVGGGAADGDFRLAIPRGALVSRFALRRDAGVEESNVFTSRESPTPGVARLEWAGENAPDR